VTVAAAIETGRTRVSAGFGRHRTLAAGCLYALAILLVLAVVARL